MALELMLSFFSTKYLTTDGTNIFVSDETSIRQVVISTGVVSTLAGSLSGSEEQQMKQALQLG